ncbi:prephenate dehydratase [Gordonia iterans]|uniref:Prephenate dehydratase n=1 Tax=Gordonia iterans TaxID=1004901 RepID=A0A2S0KC38_9ACTN|nr:prephenate dehydratase [Gordonia iterans]AVL99252.1 prephenate dehydratase [Gordonia iterans]
MPVFAYFGPAGTFTEMALKRLLDARAVTFDDDAQAVPADSPAAAIAMLRSGAVDYACVPIDSSLEGSVPATMDALVPRAGEHRVQAYAEVALDIAFTIAARTTLPAEQVRTVAAYPVASAQVRRTVGERFPNAQFVPASSNSGAALDVSEGRADAAVTTPIAAELHGLTPLAKNVADADDAVTRFLLLGRPGPPPPRTGADRTSVILDLPNRPGSLVSAMSEFSTRGVDLTRIESRPRGAGGVGQYRFYLDAAGHIDDAAVGEALRALHRSVERVLFLGSWPADRNGGASPPPDHEESLAWFTALRRGGEGT